MTDTKGRGPMTEADIGRAKKLLGETPVARGSPAWWLEQALNALEEARSFSANKTASIQVLEQDLIWARDATAQAELKSASLREQLARAEAERNDLKAFNEGLEDKAESAEAALVKAQERSLGLATERNTAWCRNGELIQERDTARLALSEMEARAVAAEGLAERTVKLHRECADAGNQAVQRANDVAHENADLIDGLSESLTEAVAKLAASESRAERLEGALKGLHLENIADGDPVTFTWNELAAVRAALNPSKEETPLEKLGALLDEAGLKVRIVLPHTQKEEKGDE